MSTVSDIDALFQLPLDAFTAARNALAVQLKKGRHAEEAAHVRALEKPSVSAWVVNQLFWRHRQAFDQLIASGEKFRQAQAAQLSGKTANLQAALDARREALSDLSKLAGRIFGESGHALSPDMQRRITTTLEALSTYGAHPDAPQAGRLTDDVDPPGFEALAALIPQQTGTRKSGRDVSRVLPFKTEANRKNQRHKTKDPGDEMRQREAARVEATQAFRTAERALKDAKKAGEQAEAALKRAAARAKSAERLKDVIEKRVEKVSAAADEARKAARGVAAQAEEAAQAIADAENAVEHARQKLRELE